jgi:hypothetical protein
MHVDFDVPVAKERQEIAATEECVTTLPPRLNLSAFVAETFDGYRAAKRRLVDRGRLM